MPPNIIKTGYTHGNLNNQNEKNMDNNIITCVIKLITDILKD